MIKLTNTWLLALTAVIMSIVFLAACKKETDNNDGRVQLVSFGPTGARHGDTIRFFGVNLNKVTAVQFTGTSAIVEQKDFKQQNSELILLVVPDAAEQGFVTLKAPEGDVVSKTQFNLNVTTTVSAITPPQARPGENITITGKFLNWVNKVTFADDKEVTTFVSKTLNQLVVRVPDDAQTGPLILSYQGTDSSFLETTDTLKVTLPRITGIAPNPVKHNTNLTITGTDLDLVKEVRFPGASKAATSFVSQAPTQLVVRVDSATVKGKVTLVAASGVQTISTVDLDVVMPTITAIAPNPVDIGANLTITGTNLDIVKSISFIGSSTVNTFVSQSPTQIVLPVPTGTLRGKVTLNIINTSLFVQSAQDLVINGSSVAPLVIYDNSINTNWEQWGGWGTTLQDMANNEHPLSGSNAIKITYSDAYGGFQLHPKTNFPFPGPYTKLKLSIYAGTNATATSRVAVYVKDNTDPTDAQSKILTLVPGTHTTYEIMLSDFTNNPAKINELVIKNYGTADITIYVDDIIFL